MNRIITIISILSAILFVSCGVDRTDEYQNLTQHNIWIYNQMSEKYLWATSLPEQDWNNYFATPSDYFAKLKKYGDDDCGSYIEIDSLRLVDSHLRGNFNHKESYGFDFALMSDPTGATTKNYARVTAVFEDSPASKAGLKRNDFIETFDGYKISSNNYKKLIYGPSHKFVVRTLDLDSVTGYYWASSRDVNIGDSTHVEDKAFPVYKTFTSHEDLIGYLMCNRLTETDVEKPSKSIDYAAQMDNIMTTFRNANVNRFILDLRYCNFGTLEMARRLASYIIPSGSLNKTFAKTVWNAKNDSNNITIPFDSSLSGKTLELDDVTILTSTYTQGAAEWVINALKFALGEDNVLIIGASTPGQNYMTQHIGDYEDMIHLYPAVAYVVDGNETHDFSASTVIAPKYSSTDTSETKLYEFGDVNEKLLKDAIYYMYDYVPTQTESTQTNLSRYIIK